VAKFLNDEDIIDIDEAAKFLGVYKGTLMRWAKEGKIPYAKIGSRWIFSKKRIREYILQQMDKEKDGE
jgi:excisionase family DNA binding protein